METRKETHPTPRQLAAFALGKLTPDGRAKMQEHVAACSTCSTFVSQTPRDTMVTLLRQAAAGLSARDQSTPGVRGASTFGGLSWAEKSQAPPNAVPVPSAAPDVSRAKSAATSAGGSAADEIPAALRVQTKYRVIRLLGRGGMGSVYEAYHERMDRRVAIKVINPSLVDNPEALKRFDQEVRAAARLHHPNVALAYDADGFGSLRALVMEFVPGQSLERYLAKQGALSVRQACDFMHQAAAGLNDAFKQGMVHRDLKPQNMMLTPEGKIKILDFGLAKLASEHRKGDGLTRENALMGTAAYLAPEQALDAAKADVRADIYALGCTLYALLAGAPPFAEGTEMKVLLAHQHDKHRPLIEARPDVPRGLSELVDRMLAKDPAGRPQTPAEVARALVPFVKGTTTTAVPPQKPPVPAQPVGKATVEVPLADESSARRRSRITIPTRLRRTAAQVGAQALAKIPPAWRWPGLVGLLSLAFLFGVWGITVLVRTPTGTIVIENVPDGAEVLVDGQTIALKDADDQVTVEAVRKGEHTLKITRDGHEIWAEDVTIKFAGDEVKITYPKFGSEDRDEKSPGKRSEAQVRYPAAEIFADGWFIDKDELVLQRTDGEGLLAFGDPLWSDYNVTLQAMCSEGYPNFKMLFHFRDQGNYRRINLDKDGSALSSYVSHRWGSAETRMGIINLGQWYDVRLEVRGKTCTCLVNGANVFTSSTDPSLTSGRIGFAAGGTSARFRNIQVTSADGKSELWRGNPRIPPLGVIPTLAKALPTGGESGHVVDLMPLIDPRSDTVEGKWSKAESKLRTDREGVAKLRIPYRAPEEYDLHAEFTRAEGDRDVVLTVPVGKRQIVFTLGAAENTRGGFALINGQNLAENPTGFKANGMLQKGRSYKVIVYVRKQLVAASVDGKIVAEFRPDQCDFGPDPGWQLNYGEGILGLFSSWSVTEFTKLGLVEITGRGEELKLLPVGDVPSLLGESLPKEKPLQTVPLMPLIDPDRDAVKGKWRMENGELLHFQHETVARLRIPYQPPDEYDFTMEFTRLGGWEILQFLSHGGREFFFSLGANANTRGGFGLIDGKTVGENPTTIRAPLQAQTFLQYRRRYKVVIHVRRDWIAASVDGKLVAKYPTDFTNLSVPGDYSIGPNTLGVGLVDANTTFHKLEIAEITGEGKRLRDPNTPASATGAARERFPDGQVFAGTWKIDGDEIVQPVRSPNITAMAFGDPDWKDYNLNLQIKPGNIDRGFVFVSFNAQSELDFRVLRLGTKSVRSRGLLRLRGLKQEELTKDESPGSSLEGDKWHAVRIEVRGSYCKCFVNGAVVCENTDESCSIGKIGLGTSYTDARFKDITITSADDKTILWKGPPKLPADGDKGPVAQDAIQKLIAAAAAAGPEAVRKVANAEIVKGTWKIEGDELLQTSLAAENSGLAFGDPTWSRYNISLRAKSDQGIDGFSIAWHLQDVAEKLQCRVFRLGCMRNTRHDLATFINGTATGYEGKAVAASLDRARWYDVRIEVRGADCKCYLDKKLLFEETEPRLTYGRVGLGAFGTAYRFKDIKITSEDDKTVLWQGLPKLPE